MSGHNGSAVSLLSYETLVHAMAGAMVSTDNMGIPEPVKWYGPLVCAFLKIVIWLFSVRGV